MTSRGDCYEASASALLLPFQREWPDDAILVHGRPTLTRAPYVEYGHAWIELGDAVFEVSNGNDWTVRREQYYRVGKIDPDKCLRYTREEARTFLLSHRHYGPWEGPEACPPLPDYDDDDDDESGDNDG